MSLREQAAKVAQEKGRAEREAAQLRLSALIARVEKKVSDITGLTAVYVEHVDVAQIEERGGGAYSFSPRTKVIVYRKMLLVRVDDVDLLVATDAYRHSSSGLDVTLGLHDPEHGWYQPCVPHRSFYLIGDSKNLAPAKERTEKFVKDLAEAQRRSTRDHPVVQLRKEGESCPTCGRGF